jgi:hypothetical protein
MSRKSNPRAYFYFLIVLQQHSPSNYIGSDLHSLKHDEKKELVQKRHLLCSVSFRESGILLNDVEISPKKIEMRLLCNENPYY